MRVSLSFFSPSQNCANRVKNGMVWAGGCVGWDKSASALVAFIPGIDECCARRTNLRIGPDVFDGCLDLRGDLSRRSGNDVGVHVDVRPLIGLPKWRMQLAGSCVPTSQAS